MWLRMIMYDEFKKSVGTYFRPISGVRKTATNLN
jgi:hypothetical protein